MSRNFCEMMETLEAPAILSEHQRNMIRHGLGLAQNPLGIASRNTYLTGRDGPDLEAWRDLESRGLALSYDTQFGFAFAASGKAARTVKKHSECFSRDVAEHLNRIDRQIKEKNRAA
jgi:hypothetical protein